MEERISFKCDGCGANALVYRASEVPECCGMDMKLRFEPLPQCTSAPHAEMARNNADDGPCDDNRGQQ